MAAEAVVSFAVETLGNLLVQKAVFLQGVEGQVQLLKDELKRMQCFLKDAAQKQANDERVRNWISDIRELAHDAEDAVEMFVLKVENARSSRGLLEKCACFPNHLHHLNKVGEEIESLRERLQHIERSRLTYGIENLGEGTASSWRSAVESRRRLDHWQKDEYVVGLEKDVELLLRKAILEDREGLSSATITGMAGIGKSTLARMVYNHAGVAVQFEWRAWVVVSSEFTPEDIIKQIMLQLQNTEEDRKKVLKDTKKLEESTKEKLRVQQMLCEMLYKQLEGKRYFIVLDDVWEDTHWDALAGAFPDEENSSRLLLTSRNQVITEYSRFIHPMKPLDPNESWKLFLKKASIDNIDGKCPEDLENIGREIVNKCKGLPLAIHVIGGVLVKQTQSKSRWERILKGLNYYLGRSERNVSAILELSYHNLPPQLKPCFLCVSFFKEDATIRAKKLVHIWVAQGFVPQEGEETLEETARGYLDELINRNMVQIKDMTEDDQIESCQVHDLIRDLSITKAKEEMSFEILRKEGDSHSSHKPRHCAMYCNRGRFIDSTNEKKHLRSLFIYENIDVRLPSSYWKNFLLLRVLDFENCYSLRKFPDAIVALTGLRYLGLRGTGIEKLPRSLGKLKNLQVLDLRELFSLEIPDVIWKMDSLRHFYTYDAVHLKINNLKNAQTLSIIRLRDSDLEQVSQMTSLCYLGVDLSGISDVSKLLTSLAKLENLVRLNLRNHRSLNLEGLGTLHRVTQLNLGGHITMLPSATNFPPNLSCLTLYGTYLKADPMRVLEKLPKLLHLKLKNGAYTGEQMLISHDGFPKLKVLKLRRLYELKNIQIGRGAMPELKQLEISYCGSLQSLPEEVKAMSNLKELKMVTTTDLAAKLRGVDSHIISNIPSLHLVGDPDLDRIAERRRN